MPLPHCQTSPQLHLPGAAIAIGFAGPTDQNGSMANGGIRMRNGGQSRDYFQVEDENGQRFWLFRKGNGLDASTGDLSWYLHGLF